MLVSAEILIDNHQLNQVLDSLNGKKFVTNQVLTTYAFNLATTHPFKKLI